MDAAATNRNLISGRQKIDKVVQQMLLYVLRLPGLFLIDLMVRFLMGNGGRGDELQKNLHSITKLQNEFTSWARYAEFSRFVKARNFDNVLENVLIGSVFTFGLTFLALPAQKLVSFYLHIFSVLLLGIGYYLSYRYVQEEQAKSDDMILNDFGKFERHGFYFLCQVLLAGLVSCLLSVKSCAARLSLVASTVPILVRICGFPIAKLHLVHNVACCFLMLAICIYFLNTVPDILTLIRQTKLKLRHLADNGDYLNVAYAVWKWLSLPAIFATFFAALFILEVYIQYGTISLIFFNEATSWCSLLVLLIANCCLSPLSLIGFCASTYFLSYFTLTVVKNFLAMDSPPHQENDPPPLILGAQDLENERERENVILKATCSTSCVTLLVLALETQIWDRSREQKVPLIGVLLFILVSTVMQSIFDVWEPILLRISSIPFSQTVLHSKCMFISVLLFFMPIRVSLIICRFLAIDVWLMIIISSCALISIQTLGSIINYCLFTYDSRFNNQGKTWDSLDDWVFYCRSTVRVIEFSVALSVIITFGVNESLHGDWSISSLLILIAHAYINVWQRLQSGWSTFLLRRQAAKKLNAFKLASKEQLLALQDVCSICYQEMNEARLTPCRHFFHSGCLKKWLYVQQTCPMCHSDLSKVTTINNSTNSQQGDQTTAAEPDQNDSPLIQPNEVQ